LPYPYASHPARTVEFDGSDLLAFDESQLCKVCGNGISSDVHGFNI